MKELFEKQKKFNDLVIKNLCERTQMDIKPKQFITEDLLAVTVELGEFIKENDQQLKKLEYADILSFLMNCGLTLKLNKYVPSIIILYARADKNIYADALLNFNIKFSEFCNAYRGAKYWSTNREARIDVKEKYFDCFIALFGIAKTVGYGIEDIREVYEKKNKINYERQQGGY